MNKTKWITLLLFGVFALTGITSCGDDDDISSDKSEGTYKGHDYVDLGLPSGTLWATCNVGSSTSTGFGYYFAWGETSAKSNYSYDNYKWSAGYQNFTKYCDDSSYGTVDNILTLEESDDAACTAWGGKWRTPTYAQWNELVTNCTISETEVNGTEGVLVKGPNGNSIFLPEAGWVNGTSKHTSRYWYWSSSVKPNANCDVYYFDGDGMDHSRDDRPSGGTIRPVCMR